MAQPTDPDCCVGCPRKDECPADTSYHGYCRPLGTSSARSFPSVLPRNGEDPDICNEDQEYRYNGENDPSCLLELPPSRIPHQPPTPHEIGVVIPHNISSDENGDVGDGKDPGSPDKNLHVPDFDHVDNVTKHM